MMHYFEIPSVDASLRKPLLDGVINKLLQESGLDISDIYYNDGENDNKSQPGSTVGHRDEITFGSSNYCTVDFTETRADTNRIARGVGLDREVPIFYDRKREIVLQPIMTQYDVELTVTRTSHSKDVLQRWVNRLNSLLDMGRGSLMVDSESFYYIPFPALELLHACYTAINTRGVEYESYKEYLNRWLNKSVTTVVTQTGTNPRLAGRFNASRIELVYDTAPPVREKQELSYTATLTVTFTYMRPDELLCNLPVVMRQTKLAEKWCPQPEPTWLSNVEAIESSAVQQNMEIIKNGVSVPPTYDDIEKLGVVQLPWLLTGEDTLSRIHNPYGDKVAFILGSDILFSEGSMQSPAFIMTREDLPYAWDPDIQEYIDKCISLDPTGRNCIFQQDVYKGRAPVKSDKLRWNAAGELELHEDVQVDINYFVTEKLILDWDLVPYDDILILRQYPKVVNKLIDWLHPTCPKPEVLVSTGKIDWKEFDFVVNEFKGSKSVRRYHSSGIGMTVLNTTILTANRS